MLPASPLLLTGVATVSLLLLLLPHPRLRPCPSPLASSSLLSSCNLLALESLPGLGDRCTPAWVAATCALARIYYCCDRRRAISHSPTHRCSPALDSGLSSGNAMRSMHMRDAVRDVRGREGSCKRSKEVPAKDAPCDDQLSACFVASAPCVAPLLHSSRLLLPASFDSLLRHSPVPSLSRCCPHGA